MTEEAKKSVTVRMAERFGLEPAAFQQTLMSTVMPNGATKEQVAALLVVAERHGLNPWTKEIYAFPAKGGGITPVVGVDGWIRLINSHPQFDGMELEDQLDEEGNAFAVKCSIFRKDRAHPTTVTEYLKECYRPTEPWKSHPRRMLRHKALIQGARVAFGFAGIYDEDEAARIVEAQVVTTHAASDPPADMAKLTEVIEQENAAPEGSGAGLAALLEEDAQ